MIEINWNLSTHIKAAFPGRIAKEHIYHVKGKYRWIQIFTPKKDENLHYEVINGKIELHFEGDEYASKYEKLIDYLMSKTENKEDFVWGEWESGYRCQWTKELNNEDYEEDIKRFVEKFDSLIGKYNENAKEDGIVTNLGEEDSIPHVDESAEKKSSVSLYICNLEQVLKLPLSIPDYQRIYCWEEQNVICLLEDVNNFIKNNTGTYRLGTLILHCFKDSSDKDKYKYAVIDGQQRLITLAIWLAEMKMTTGLLKEKLWSKQSKDYVSNNKYLIREFCEKLKKKGEEIETLSKEIIKSIEFSVLVLENTSIDLAYTFFSNQNSRGVALTDYDLLKAHHLRYIPLSFKQQATNAAETWNKMIEDGRSEREKNGVSDYERTLDTYIYRLRRWMRKRECQDENVKYRVKQEYEATPIIEGIPPFGERFYFNEPIQGGTHFFEFVKQHIVKYRRFTKTAEYCEIHYKMVGRNSCLYYRDVIESILFAYYLKFEENYLADALAVIMRIILQHRYDNNSAQKKSVVRYARDKELVLMIDQATSPTFFLAEAWNVAKDLFINTNQPIKRFMSDRAKEIMGNIKESITITSFKELNNKV